MKNYCIDVFFRYRDIPIHVLTYGSFIPNLLNDLERNRKEQKRQAKLMQENVDMNWIENRVQINNSYISFMTQQVQKTKNEFSQRDVLLWFLPFAALGFYTYDCIISNDEKAEFKLVALPKTTTTVIDELLRYDNLRIVSFLDNSQIPETFAWEY